MSQVPRHVQVVARIQAHPARRHLHQALVDSIGLPTEVYEHESDPGSPWAGYKRCLADVPAGVSHLLILQDDAVVCNNFAPAVEQIAASNPDTPIVLFLAHLPRRTARDATRAMKAKQCYVDLFIRDFVPVVGMLWPVHKAQEFLAWTKVGRLPGGEGARSDDAVCGRWMLMTRQRIRACVPSLVQHPDLEPSLIGRKPAWGKDKGRVALFLAQDGLDYDW